MLAADRGLARAPEILDRLEAAERPEKVLRSLRLERPDDRFAIYFALQEAVRRIARHPRRLLKLALAVLDLPRDLAHGPPAAEMLPGDSLTGQAHLLAGNVYLWLKDFDAVETHLQAAYFDLARASDETALAVVEVVESQRRTFTGDSRSALSLASRARATFEERSMEDSAARAGVAEGLALASLGRQDEAIACYRRALPVFERLGLWNNYVGAMNSLATALQKSGSLDEARRGFARAFRRLSRSEHRSWLGFLRQGLGEILFAAGKFRDAADSYERAAKLYADSELRARELDARLAEVDSWVRAERHDIASSRLRKLSQSVRRDRDLKPALRREMSSALARVRDDVEQLNDVRTRIRDLLAIS